MEAYQERLAQEYQELCSRIVKLKKILHDMDKDCLDFIADCSYDQLNRQYLAMDGYREALEQRFDFRDLVNDGKIKLLENR